VTNDPFIRGEFGGRGLVPGKSRLGEYLHPERYANGQGGLFPEDDATSSGSRSLVLKLVVMAMVAIALLVAIIVIFT